VSDIQLKEYEALILKKSNREKAEYGQQLVQFLGGTPGPLGRDGGVDGWYVSPGGGETIYFQVKLTKSPISRDLVRLIRQTCSDHGSTKAILVSVRNLSAEAQRYVEQHQDSFSLCHVRIVDILTAKHYTRLTEAGFPEAKSLADKLTGALQALG
jgi:hypothetical protein